MTTYLVTGSTGYIGKHLIAALQEEPDAEIYGLSHRKAPEATGWQSLEMDLLAPNLADLVAVLAPDVIFHLAAAPRDTSIEIQLAQNVQGTQNLLNALVQNNLRPRVVVVGSAAEYGPQASAVDELSPLKPVGDYGMAKGAQTQVALRYVKDHQLPVMVARIFNVYGNTPKSLAIGAIALRLAQLEQEAPKNPVLKIRNLYSSRDFVHLQDVLSALRLLAAKGQPGEIYNIASGEAQTLYTVMQTLAKLSTLPELAIEPDGEPSEDFSQAVIQKLQTATGWAPTVSLEAGLAQELAYWRAQVALQTMLRPLV